MCGWRGGAGAGAVELSAREMTAGGGGRREGGAGGWGERPAAEAVG